VVNLTRPPAETKAVGTRDQGTERRQSIRIKARMRCEIGVAGRFEPGQILDVSEGGLSLRGDLDVEQGSTLAVRLRPPHAGEIEIKAIVWHLRRMRSAAGKTVCICGMMLSEPTEAWTEWIRGALEATKRATTPRMVAAAPEAAPEPQALPKTEAKPRPRALPRPKAPVSRPSAPPPSTEAELLGFRIRVKSLVGPRTRTLTLSAVDEAEARTLAEENLGADWKILEIYAV
jgi:hypothetical protein